MLTVVTSTPAGTIQEELSSVGIHDEYCRKLVSSSGRHSQQNLNPHQTAQTPPPKQISTLASTGVPDENYISLGICARRRVTRTLTNPSTRHERSPRASSLERKRSSLRSKIAGMRPRHAIILPNNAHPTWAQGERCAHGSHRRLSFPGRAQTLFRLTAGSGRCNHAFVDYAIVGKVTLSTHLTDPALQQISTNAMTALECHAGIDTRRSLC